MGQPASAHAGGTAVCNLEAGTALLMTCQAVQFGGLLHGLMAALLGLDLRG